MENKIGSGENTSRYGLFIGLLLPWYDNCKRDLPWRKTRDPYAIWVCEIMAQQTRISALLPYYERFMVLFPTVHDLASASIDQVLKAWEGLGYYSRAHSLHKTAGIIDSVYGGQFPEDAKALKSLPGIGDYTAGAIASICFQKPVPAVDGNVLRVFSRIEEIDMDIAALPVKKYITEKIQAIIPKEAPGSFNQSLMELGALVCLPQKPLCGICPVSGVCRACEKGRQHDLPVKTGKKPLVHTDKTILIIVDGHGRVLMRQRTERLLCGLWEFVMADGKLPVDKVRDYLRDRLGAEDACIRPVGEASHVFTHMVWNMNGYFCKVKEAAEPEDFQFVGIDRLQDLAIASAIGYYGDWFKRSAAGGDFCGYD